MTTDPHVEVAPWAVARPPAIRPNVVRPRPYVELEPDLHLPPVDRRPRRGRATAGPTPGPAVDDRPTVAPSLGARLVVVLLLLTVFVAAAVAAGGWLGVGPGAAEPPTVTAIVPDVQARVDAALAAAAAVGVPLEVTSGWRSAEEQQALVDAAVAQHGSLEAARPWVLPPERSAHVQGTAVDVGPAAGAAWLAERGAEHGLCLRYANEPWHFEPLTEPGGRCPAPLPDATADWG